MTQFLSLLGGGEGWRWENVRDPRKINWFYSFKSFPSSKSYTDATLEPTQIMRLGLEIICKEHASDFLQPGNVLKHHFLPCPNWLFFPSFDPDSITRCFSNTSLWNCLCLILISDLLKIILAYNIWGFFPLSSPSTILGVLWSDTLHKPWDCYNRTRDRNLFSC